jgi:hypothetical protein
MKTRPCAGLFGVMISSAFGLCSAAARELWQQPAERPAHCGESLAGKGAAEAQQRWGVRAVPRFDHGIGAAAVRSRTAASRTPTRRSMQHWSAPAWCRRSAHCGRRGRSKAGRWLPPAPIGAGAIGATQQTVGQAHRNSEPVASMRRTVEVNVTSLRLRAAVLAIAASLLAGGCVTEPPHGAPLYAGFPYSSEVLARAADELDVLPPLGDRPDARRLPSNARSGVAIRAPQRVSGVSAFRRYSAAMKVEAGLTKLRTRAVMDGTTVSVRGSPPQASMLTTHQGSVAKNTTTSSRRELSPATRPFSSPMRSKTRFPLLRHTRRGVLKIGGNRNDCYRRPFDE